MKKYVLLIDDDEDELEIFSDALDKTHLPFDFYCRQAKNVEQAIKAVRSFQTDFIFLDFNMPLMNGLNVFEAIKQVKTASRIPVIFYSSIIDDEINKKAMAMGASACLRKPYHTSTLTRKLRDILLQPRFS